MATHLNPRLITVEEYYELPERDDVIVELHNGHIVELSRPKYWHVKMQERIAQLLRERCGPDWLVHIELPFRGVPQYDLRAVDVGVIARNRADAIGEGDLVGPPEIVIEILSPSNRRKEIEDKMALCVGAGTQQFCVVDRNRRTVSVITPNGKTDVYQNDDEIPFALLSASIKVSEIW